MGTSGKTPGDRAAEDESPADATDDAKFNETLKRMLQTPPKRHEKAEKPKDDAKPRTGESIGKRSVQDS